MIGDKQNIQVYSLLSYCLNFTLHKKDEENLYVFLRDIDHCISCNNDNRNDVYYGKENSFIFFNPFPHDTF